MAVNPKRAARKSVARYRDRMRRSGLRLAQIWVPDDRVPQFAAECRRQSRAATLKRRAEEDVLSWIDATRDTKGWTR